MSLVKIQINVVFAFGNELNLVNNKNTSKQYQG